MSARRLGAGRRPGGPRRAAHPHQDLLRLPEPLRRRAEHEHLPGVPRPARQPPGAQRAGGRAGHPPRRGAALRGPPCDLRTGRTTSTRTCRRTTRSASTTSRSTCRAGWSCRRARASASRAPTWRRTPASPPTWATPAGASTAASTRSSTTTAPACRSLEIVSEPDMRSSDDATAYVNELRAILVATGVSDAKMEEGSMRVDANVSVRRAAPSRSALAARSRTSTRSGRSGGPSSTRRAARSRCSRPVRSIRQETRHWAEDDGRTHTLRTKEEAEDYRYFPEPDLVPLRARRQWLGRVRPVPAAAAGRAPRQRLAGGGRGRAGRPGRGGRRRPGPRRARRRGARGRRRPGSRARPRRAQPRRRRRRAASARAARRAHPLEVDGTAHRHPGQGGAGRAGGGRRRRRSGGHRRRRGLRGDGTTTRWRRPSTTAIAAQRGAWESTSAARTRSPARSSGRS